jgi:repressor LexA
MAMEKLTNRQREVLAAVRELTGRHGFPPTVRELAEFLEIGPRAAFEHLAALVRKGYLEKEDGRPRALAVAGYVPALELPVVGRVAAGPPITALEEAEETMAVDRSLGAAEGDFLLRVKGDSMDGEHIIDGDMVIVRPQPVAENGAVVVALVGDEATVKRMYVRGDRIILRAANPAYADLVLGEEEDVAVIGRVVGVIRRYK